MEQIPSPLEFINPNNIHNPFTLGLMGELLFGLWAIMTIVFLYHWWKYSPSKLVALRATAFYFAGSIIINIIITGALAIR